MRYLIRFSYDGALFHGFQRQKDVKNVQGTLENVLSEYFQENIVIKGSGRTDAGVHAKGQCAHFDVDKLLVKNDIKNINELLKGEIVIKSYKKVSNNFHARHSVKKKTYIYKVNNGEFRNDFVGYYYQVRYKYDMKLMKKACKILKGCHDYHNFVSGKRDNYETYIYNIKIRKNKDMIIFKFEGTGFYRYMVRHLVGAILDVGRGKSSLEELSRMVNDSNYDRKLSIVPADGLILEKIKY